LRGAGTYDHGRKGRRVGEQRSGVAVNLSGVVWRGEKMSGAGGKEGARGGKGIPK